MHRRFIGKFDRSDEVQATLIEVWQGLGRMEATGAAQRMAWLRQVLTHQLAGFVRCHKGAQKRNVQSELSTDETLGNSAPRLDLFLATREPAPCTAAIAKEERRHF